MMKSDNINYTLPSGFSELLPGEKRLENYLLDTIRQVFERYGFSPIETPTVERLEVLQAKGNQGDNIIYSVTPIVSDNGQGNDEARSENRGLKFDQTVPLAAYIARHLNELTFPFARYQMDMVFRGERAKKGRYRQFRQCDIDVVGRNNLSLLYDAQMPAIINEIFSSLHIGNFLIRISNRKILAGIFKVFGIPEVQVKSCIRIIDSLDKLGKEKVRKIFLSEGVSELQVSEIMNFVNFRGNSSDILNSLRDKLSSTREAEELEQGVNELDEVVKYIKLLQVPEEKFCIDLSIARGLDYYTGTVYETSLVGYEALGSICSGGRYEELVSIFVGNKMPGVGLSIGLTRLMRCLLDEKLLSPMSVCPAQIMVLNMRSELMQVYFEVSQKLRGADINVFTSFAQRPIGKQIQQADKLGIPLCLIIGPDEHMSGTCRIKNLKTGQQLDVSQGVLIDTIRNQISNQFS
ncbi:MAG: histidine--tRNA ligase [Cyanothece sp. SIO1E1]|nr:histidine--tRNA ligase [Cyanothece sp. SIO1E1]